MNQWEENGNEERIQKAFEWKIITGKRRSPLELFLATVPISSFGISPPFSSFLSKTKFHSYKVDLFFPSFELRPGLLVNPNPIFHIRNELWGLPLNLYNQNYNLIEELRVLDLWKLHMTHYLYCHNYHYWCKYCYYNRMKIMNLSHYCYFYFYGYRYH